MNTIGDNFQQETKYHKDKMSGKPLDWASQAKIYKNYPDCQTIELPGIAPLASAQAHAGPHQIYRKEFTLTFFIPRQKKVDYLLFKG